MLLTDLLSPDCLIVPLEAADKQSAIFQLAELLCEKAQIPDAGGFKDAIWEREITRSTGFGYGVAAPHHRTDAVDKVHIAMGVAQAGIDFQAVDKQPVDIIVVIASPTGEPKVHIDALSYISRMFVEEEIRQALRAADSPAALYATIQDVQEGLS